MPRESEVKAPVLGVVAPTGVPSIVLPPRIAPLIVVPDIVPPLNAPLLNVDEVIATPAIVPPVIAAADWLDAMAAAKPSRLLSICSQDIGADKLARVIGTKVDIFVTP